MKKIILDKFLSASKFIADKTSEKVLKQNLIHFLIGNNQKSSDSLIDSESSNGICVSLTTFGRRIHDVFLTIESIGCQTIKPEKLVLWLAEDEFNSTFLPITLKNQIRRGLEIRYYKDIKAYKKIIPTLKVYPSYLIITVDDDVMYNFDLIETLYQNYKTKPNTIYCGDAKRMIVEGTNVDDYKKWLKNDSIYNESLLNFAIGYGGVLYFPGCFPDEVLNEKVFTKLAPYNDDIWLKAMTLINGVKVQSIKNQFSSAATLVPIQITQQDSLSIINVVNNKNNQQLKAVFDEYNCYEYLRQNENL